MHKKTVIFVLVFIAVFFLVGQAWALDPLVPCGREGTPDCQTCDILKLVKNISDFILTYLVPGLATLFFLWAGFLILLGGGIPSQVQSGKNIFKTTVYGIAIMMLAWLIVNTVLRTVAGDQNIANEWWKLECQESAAISPISPANPINPSMVISAVMATEITDTTAVITWTTNQPSTSQVQFGKDGQKTILDPQLVTAHRVTVSGLNAGVTYAVQAISLNQNSFQAISGLITFKAGAPDTSAVTCMFSGVNLCEGGARVGGCGPSICSTYRSFINNQASKAGISANLLKAFMAVESDCNIKAATESSYGLMQLQPATATRFKSFCGAANENTTSDWLMSPQNAEKSICIAAQFIKSIAAGTCGSQPRNIYAGYNGGEAGATSACAPSVDCASEKSCDGGVVKRWECLYDNPEHTICNGGNDIKLGYNQTKRGARYVTYCVAHPGF